MVLISLYIKCHKKKKGRLLVNTQISTAALIRVAALVLLALNKVYVYILTLTELGSGFCDDTKVSCKV